MQRSCAYKNQNDRVRLDDSHLPYVALRDRSLFFPIFVFMVLAN